MAKPRLKRRQRTDNAKQGPAPSAVLYPVWDLPTRLSHLLITVLFVLLFAGGHFGLGPGWLHLWAGYLLLVIVLFRIGWGLTGSESARFGHMLPGPRRLMAYLPVLFSRQRSDHAGHNPVGALSTVLILGLLLAQSITGLFHESWGELRGPLAERVSRSTVILMSDLHGLLRWPLLLVITIHIVAVLGYLLFKREDRITPIFAHGRLPVASDPELKMQGMIRAAFVLLASLLPVALIIWLGPID